eukprot:TRINITY_DN5075_c0_g1_i11.p1 TRINITY_DN5075_c0_g1~~TRINITY_DN5075_c0_g1_i11.p1  ORF type:complete len:213 (-),score=31.87 TRINITY_DN5075_c0_g1_i11:143-781(-)
MNFFRAKQIETNFKVLVWYAGFRGAMAFALALNSSTILDNESSKNGSILLTYTLLLACIYIFLFAPMLQTILAQYRLDGNENIGNVDKNYCWNHFKKNAGLFEKKFIKRVFVGDVENADDSDDEDDLKPGIEALEPDGPSNIVMGIEMSQAGNLVLEANPESPGIVGSTPIRDRENTNIDRESPAKEDDSPGTKSRNDDLFTNKLDDEPESS